MDQQREQELLRELVLICDVNNATDYQSVSSVQASVARLNDEDDSLTSIGKKFKHRLLDMLGQNQYSHTCVICGRQSEIPLCDACKNKIYKNRNRLKSDIIYEDQKIEKHIKESNKRDDKKPYEKKYLIAIVIVSMAFLSSCFFNIYLLNKNAKLSENISILQTSSFFDSTLETEYNNQPSGSFLPGKDYFNKQDGSFDAQEQEQGKEQEIIQSQEEGITCRQFLEYLVNDEMQPFFNVTSGDASDIRLGYTYTILDNALIIRAWMEGDSDAKDEGDIVYWGSQHLDTVQGILALNLAKDMMVEFCDVFYDIMKARYDDIHLYYYQVSSNDKEYVIFSIQDGYLLDMSGYVLDEIHQPFLDEASEVSAGKRNALGSALRLLDVTAFSYEGLYDQLLFEGYSEEEAEYAVMSCSADWNYQAYLSAKSYLKISSFSKQQLLEQLEFEGFTQEQAMYGVVAAYN